jgi:hypothetical protein
MSCILRIGGKDLDIDTFIEKSKLSPYKKRYKGQPRRDSKPGGEKLADSYILIEVSNADFSEFQDQIIDSIQFLKSNKQKLLLIAVTKEIEYAVLDFGIENKIDNIEVHIQSQSFPAELLKLSGELGIDIELSIYG